MRKASILELFKTLLLILLIVFTVWLALRSWFYDETVTPKPIIELAVRCHRLLGLDSPYYQQAAPVLAGVRSYGRAILPSRCVVTVSGSRFGAEYGDSVEQLFNSMSAVVGEVVGSSGTASEVDFKQWYAALSGDSVYFEFLGSAPLSLISLSSGIEQSFSRTAFAGKLLLSASEEHVRLFYIDSQTGSVMQTTTAVVSELLMRLAEDQLGSTAPCRLLCDDQKGLDDLSGCTLFFGGSCIVSNLTVSDSSVSTSAYDLMLDAFRMNPNTNYRYEQEDGSRVTLENERSFVLTSDRAARYSDLDKTGGFQVYSQPDDFLEAELIEEMRRVVNSASDIIGNAEFYLSGFERTGDTYELYFGYAVDGVPIFTKSTADSAYFRIENGILVYAEIQLKTFTLGDSQVQPLPSRWTALLSGSEGVPCLCYMLLSNRVEVDWYLENEFTQS